MLEDNPKSNKDDIKFQLDEPNDTVLSAIIPNNSDDVFTVVIDEPDFLPINFLQKGLILQKCVARILLPSGGCATGFLITPNLLITNNHVLPSREIARIAKFLFNYQDDVTDREELPSEYSANAEIYYSNSRMDCDFAIVGISGNPGNQWGYTSLLSHVQTEVGKNCIIIQIPEGMRKQIVIHNSIIVEFGPRVLKYTADAVSGSSGSPIFDDFWRLIGVHQSEGDLKENPTVGLRKYKNNRGIPIQIIMDELKLHSHLADVQNILKDLENSTNPPAPNG